MTTAFAAGEILKPRRKVLLLAQAFPTRITDRETLMIGFGVSLVEFILATFAPIFVGMFLLVTLSNATHVDIRYLSAYALGLLF
jgi:hypothetical protein